MLCVLDMLFSKDFQTKCTWTGASRKGPKLAIMPNRNILQVFQQIGSDETEVVTQRKLADFFKKKLKNSLKRSIAIGIRRGTRHVRRRKQTKALQQEVKMEPVGGSSNVLGGQIDEAEMSCESFDEPESEDAGSAVNSSDALDHADIQTNLITKKAYNQSLLSITFSLVVRLHEHVAFDVLYKVVLNYVNFMLFVKYFNCWIS